MAIPRQQVLVAAAGFAAVLVAAIGIAALLPGGSDGAPAAAVSLLGWGCTDASICSKWSLLRTKQVQRNSKRSDPSKVGAASHPRERRGRRGGGVEESGRSHSLVTAPLDAAASILERNLRFPLRGERRSSAAAAARATAQPRPLVGHPSLAAGLNLRKGSLLHVETSHGRLPLIVDGAPDADGDVSVHGFREGLKYVGKLRVRALADGISFPPSSMLRAAEGATRGDAEEEVRGTAQVDGLQKAVGGKLWMTQDNGVVTTINTRAQPNGDNALSYAHDFKYVPGGGPAVQDNGVVTTINTRAQRNGDGALSFPHDFKYGSGATPSILPPRGGVPADGWGPSSGERALGRAGPGARGMPGGQSRGGAGLPSLGRGGAAAGNAGAGAGAGGARSVVHTCQGRPCRTKRVRRGDEEDDGAGSGAGGAAAGGRLAAPAGAGAKAAFFHPTEVAPLPHRPAHACLWRRLQAKAHALSSILAGRACARLNPKPNPRALAAR